MSDDPLDALYPWQAEAGSDPGDLAASVMAKLEASQAAARTFVADQGEALIAAARDLADCFAAGGRLFTLGNGGSACDAAHIAVEFQHPVTAGRPALPAIHLGADTAMLTAVANDVGVDEIFLRPLIAQARAGDALIGVSTSGNSPNLIAAMREGARRQMLTIALSGAGGGAVAQLDGLDHCLVVPSDSVHRVQETQVLIYHLLWDLVHSQLAARR